MRSRGLSIERYRSATNFATPKLAPQLNGLMGDGYWIDDHRYFYCVSRVSPDGNQAMQPMIVDGHDGTIMPPICATHLAQLLSSHSEQAIAVGDLGKALYDMPDADTLVVVLANTAYHVELGGPALTKIESIDLVPALYSPDGKFACFLKDYAVWVKDITTGTTRQLSPDGEAQYAFGHALESGVAPLSSRKAPVPFGLWSADSQWFATHQIDERSLPDGGIVEHAPAGGGPPVVHMFKTASPGDALPLVEFVAIHVPTGRTVSAAERAVYPQAYSPFAFRACWFAAGNMYYLDYDRFCAEVALVELDLNTGALRTVIKDRTDSGWLELHPAMGGQPIVRVLAASNEIIWFSERDGHSHLYLYDLTTGVLKNQITSGAWMVRELVHVDESERRILFLANGSPAERDPGLRRLCAANFDGSASPDTLIGSPDDIGVFPKPISGVYQLKPFRPSYALSGVSGNGRYVVASLNRADVPMRMMLIDLATGRQVQLTEVDIEMHWHAPKPRPFEALAGDGVTKLYGALYLPSDFDESKSYPLVDYIYPGPQVNWFSRRFPSALGCMLQSVVELGAAGIIIESRGMPLRSRAFHQAGASQLHEPQLSDHVAVIEQLCARHAFLDHDRVGIFGQSAGGYATARALFDYPDLFKVGVSVCGNHDNRNYTAHWLDKYGSRPGARGRDTQSNITAASKLRGKLLLIHGDMDENVHVGHTLALSAALIAAGKDFDHLIVPGAGHGVLFESSYVLRRLWDYFARYLLDAEPPSHFTIEYDSAEVAAAMRMAASELA